MSLLFGDIYEAIRCERAKKGAHEKNILNAVQERVGGCLSVKNVLKTLKTLQKLVDDGVLIKKRKCYMINTEKSSENSEQQENDEEQGAQNNKDEDNDCDDFNDEGDEDEEEDENDDENEEDEEEENQCCKGEEEQQNEDEDEDDVDDNGEDGDEDNEDDDDDFEDNEDDDDDGDNDDDDDDNCENQESEAAKKTSPSKVKSPEKEKSKDKSGSLVRKSTPKIIVSANQSKSPETFPEREAKKNDCRSSMTRDKNPGEKKMMETTAEKKGRGGENIAFCARDFIDSQNRPRTHSKIENKFATMGALMQEKINTAEGEEVRSILKDSKMNFQGKRRKTSNSKMARKKCQSRFPSKKYQANGFSNLKTDCFETTRGINNQYAEEPMETDAELNSEKDKDVKMENEAPQFRSSCEILPISASRADIENLKSGIDGQTEKCQSFPERKNFMARNALPEMMTTMEADSVQKVPRRVEEHKIKRKKEFSDDENNDDNDKTSLCSLCEKTVKHPRIEKT